jgi:hypothetical protein
MLIQLWESACALWPDVPDPPSHCDKASMPEISPRGLFGQSGENHRQK